MHSVVSLNRSYLESTLFDLECYSPFNTDKVMSSWSDNLLILFLGRLSL